MLIKRVSVIISILYCILFCVTQSPASSITGWLNAENISGTLINTITGEVLNPSSASITLHVNAAAGLLYTDVALYERSLNELSGTTALSYTYSGGPYVTANSGSMTYDPRTNLGSFSGSFTANSAASQGYGSSGLSGITQAGADGDFTYNFHVTTAGKYAFVQAPGTYSYHLQFTQNDTNPVGFVHLSEWFGYGSFGNILQQGSFDLLWVPGIPYTDYVDNIIDSGVVSGSTSGRVFGSTILVPGDYQYTISVGTFGSTYSLVNAVPTPSSIWLLSSGLLGLAGWRRIRKG